MATEIIIALVVSALAAAAIAAIAYLARRGRKYDQQRDQAKCIQEWCK